MIGNRTYKQAIEATARYLASEFEVGRKELYDIDGGLKMTADILKEIGTA